MITVDLTAKTSRTTAMLYGATRSGKTRHAATWPRPLFLADVTEGGWLTVQNMDPSEFYEPKRPPIIWGIEKPSDMMPAIVAAEKLFHEKKINTLVIDSITFYADRFRTFMQSVEKIDNRQAYGKLGDHLMFVRDRVHSVPWNVLWLALERAPSEDDKTGGPALPGQASQKFAAACDYIMYAVEVVDPVTKQPRHEIRTKKYGPYMAGGRDMGYLPDPLACYRKAEDGTEVLVPGTDYRTFETAMGISPIASK